MCNMPRAIHYDAPCPLRLPWPLEQGQYMYRHNGHIAAAIQTYLAARPTTPVQPGGYLLFLKAGERFSETAWPGLETLPGRINCGSLTHPGVNTLPVRFPE